MFVVKQGKSYQIFEATSTILKLHILLLYIQLTYFSSPRTYVKFHLWNHYDHNLHEHTFLGSFKGTLYLNPIKYHCIFIENTYCYYLPLTVTQSIRNIWSTYDLTHRSKSLLILAQTQFSLKVDEQYNEITWWNYDNLITLCHDSL